MGVMFSVFFFKQKPAYEMRISDWSSDVCSSDLQGGQIAMVDADARGRRDDGLGAEGHADAGRLQQFEIVGSLADRQRLDRTSFVEGKSVSVRVALGCHRFHNKKNISSTQFCRLRTPQ